MRNILYPVSSITRSDGSIQYVGSLAHDTHAKVFLTQTQTSRQKVIALAGTNPQTEKHLPQMVEMHQYLSGPMHVDCSIEEETLDGIHYKNVGLIAGRHDIMAIPLITDDQNAEPNGLDLTKIINETQIPLFLIPENFKYKKIKCLIYAYDYKNEPDPPLHKLSLLATWFGAEVRFMSVFSRDTLTKERDRVHELHIQLLKTWKGGNKISFDTIVYPQIPKFEEHYLGQPEQGDLQVLSVSHQSFIDRLLRRGLIEGVRHSKYPYVIIHK